MTSLDTLTALLASSSARPWRVTDSKKFGGAFSSEIDGEYIGDAERLADAELIAAAVNALPPLLAIARAAFAWRDANVAWSIEDSYTPAAEAASKACDDADEALKAAIDAARESVK